MVNPLEIDPSGKRWAPKSPLIRGVFFWTLGTITVSGTLGDQSGVMVGWLFGQPFTEPMQYNHRSANGEGANKPQG